MTRITRFSQENYVRLHGMPFENRRKWIEIAFLLSPSYRIQLLPLYLALVYQSQNTVEVANQRRLHKAIKTITLKNQCFVSAFFSPQPKYRTIWEGGRGVQKFSSNSVRKKS